MLCIENSPNFLWAVLEFIEMFFTSKIREITFLVKKETILHETLPDTIS